jgi:hypothetical protein
VRGTRALAGFELATYGWLDRKDCLPTADSVANRGDGPDVADSLPFFGAEIA